MLGQEVSRLHWGEGGCQGVGTGERRTLIECLALEENGHGHVYQDRKVFSGINKVDGVALLVT